MIKKDIVIIGGGACGLLLSILLSKKGKKVTILEKNSSLAKKIRVSGNGKCNITNRNISFENYHLGSKQLIKNIISEFDYPKMKKLFSSLGIEFKEQEDGRVFPLSFNSQSVIDILKAHADSLNVDIKLNFEVIDVDYNESFLIKSKDEKLYADKLIVCSGSSAYKNIGVSDISYKIARKFQHRVHSIYPSLVQVECSDKRVHRANGLKLYTKVKIFVENDLVCEKMGDLLFTNYGLSGLVILDSSYFISKALHDKKKVFVEIDLLPDLSIYELRDILKKREKLKNILNFEIWLEGVIDKKLIPFVSIEKTINKKSINQISHTLKNLKIKIDGIRDAKYAEIIAGGVDSHELKGNLESKKQKNLFFGGEAIDICGDRGGYNLHFAFATAFWLSSRWY